MLLNTEEVMREGVEGRDEACGQGKRAGGARVQQLAGDLAVRGGGEDREGSACVHLKGGWRGSERRRLGSKEADDEERME